MKKLWICLLALCLCSCATGELAVSTQQAAPSVEAFAEEEGVVGVVVDGQCRYTVIRPERASERVRSAAQTLDTRLFYYLETHIPVKNDFAAPEEREILVGDTNRAESKALLARLGTEEFAVAVVGKKILLCGHSDRAVEQAVEWFWKEFVKEAKPVEGQTPRLIVSLKQEYRGKVTKSAA